MSNIVEQINDAFKANVATILGASYGELKYAYDVERNNFKQNKKKYGVRPLFGSTVSGILCNYTMDQEFQVVLTTDYVNKQGDLSLQNAVFELSDKMDDIFKSSLNGKLGIPTIVVVVNSFTLEEAEILDENNIVVLRANFEIKYRQALT